MYCSKCGNEIDNDALICPKCGCATANMPNTMKKRVGGDIPPAPDEDESLWKNGIILAFIIPIVGLIMGIMGCVQYKNPNYRNNSIIAIIISIIVTVIYTVIIALCIQ